MTLSMVEQPAVIAAIVAAIVSLASLSVASILNYRLHLSKLKADKDLAELKFKLDRKQNVADFSVDVLTGFYEAARSIHHIRSGGALSYEYQDREGRSNEDQGIRSAIDGYYPSVKRIRDYAPSHSILFAKRFKAVALFGTNAAKPFDDIWSVIVSVQVAAEFLIGQANSEMSRAPIATLEHQRSIIWEGYGETDSQAAVVARAIEAAEALFGDAARHF